MELYKKQWQSSFLDDRTVVKRVLDGERDLFELLMRRYNQKLFRLARGYIAEPSEAEDVLQEAYMLAYVNLHQFRGRSFGPWIARIVVNEALNRLRRKKLHLVLDVPESSGNSNTVTLFDAETSMADEVPATDQLAGREQMLGLIESAVDRLPSDFRAVFMLRAVEQMSVEETADYLNIKPATVKTRFHRAKALLQNKLQRHLVKVAGDAFSFGGARCDRIVTTVLERIALL